MPTLPDEFIVRIPAKSGAHPWSNYILVQKTVVTDAATALETMLSPVAPGASIVLTVPAVEPTTEQMFWGTFHLSGKDGKTHGKRLYIIPDLRLKKSNGELLKVFTMAAHKIILGPCVKNFTPVVEAAALEPSGTQTPSYSSAVGDEPLALAAGAAAAGVITHVPPPPSLPTLQKQLTKAKKTIKHATAVILAAAKSHSSSKYARLSLAPFVATQLLQLAIIRHEMCPIVAEEFSAGNCAAMPCGHLFAKMAIEESFKKEPSKCPACRQTGTPTFV